jgi:hypothetical protein
MLEIPRENLQHGKLYYITEYILNNNDSNRKLTKMVGIFKGLKLIDSDIFHPWNAVVFDWFEVSKMKEINNECHAYKHIILEVELNYIWKFYEVQKFKIQNDMESRAIDLFLKKITRDPYFTFMGSQITN